jgi:hypothetical protein
MTPEISLSQGHHQRSGNQQRRPQQQENQDNTGRIDAVVRLDL